MNQKVDLLSLLWLCVTNNLDVAFLFFFLLFQCFACSQSFAHHCCFIFMGMELVVYRYQ